VNKKEKRGKMKRKKFSLIGENEYKRGGESRQERRVRIP
jgi:hypothetical protein